MTEHLNQIGAYRLLKPLGSGGMGSVYLAEKQIAAGLTKRCAVKVIKPEKVHDSRYVDLFLKEARLSSLFNHQNIVQVFDFAETADKALFLAMEFVEGVDLKAFMREAANKRLIIPPEVVFKILIDVLRGLSHAHQRCDAQGQPLGIVHRDLNPNNILLSREGAVKIADFGVAKSAIDETTVSGGMKGKFHYLSPEQVTDGAEIDARSDLFSVGVMAFELLIGRNPFDADSVPSLLSKIKNETIDNPRELDGVDISVWRFVKTALEKDPENRFQSAEEMVEAAEIVAERLPKTQAGFLENLVGNLVADQPRPKVFSTELDTVTRATLGKPVRKNSLRKRTLRFAVVAIGVIVLAGIFFWADFPVGNSTGTDNSPTSGPFQPTSTPAPEVQPTPPTLANSPEPVSTLSSQVVTGDDGKKTGQETPVPTPVPTNLTPEPTQKTATQNEKPSSNQPLSVGPEPPPPAATPVPAAPEGFLAVGDLSPYATVVVDGKKMDETPTKKIALRPGSHVVTLKNPVVMKTVTFSIHIKPGATTSIAAWPEAK